MHGLWSYEKIVEVPQKLQFQMISFNLDPQWCGLLFSICCRHEKVGILGSDTFSACQISSPPLDADWIAFAGSLGFEICRLTSSWALIVDTVKASSIILLFGVGGFICYKLYHYCWPGSRSQLNSPKSSPHFEKDGRFLIHRLSNEKYLVEDLEGEDINAMEGQYFGPAQPTKTELAPQEADVTKAWVKAKLKSQQDCEAAESPGIGCTSLPDTPGRNYRRKLRPWKFVPTYNNSCKLAIKGKCDNIYSSDTVTLHTLRDGGLESLGISKKLLRESSFESTCSEISVDVSFLEASINSSTMACLENLQQEIDQLKNNCLLMDEEFETIKCNRNFPGMSSLMREGGSNNHSVNAQESTQDALNDDLKNENARACFTGLYSLTTIKDSTSSDMSDSFANDRGSIGSAESLVWDSPISFASPARSDEITDRNGKISVSRISEFNCHDDKSHIEEDYTEHSESTAHKSAQLFPTEHELMANLEWDEECMDGNQESGIDKGSLFSVESPSDVCLEIICALDHRIQQNTVMENKTTNYTVTERFSCPEKFGFENEFRDAPKLSLEFQSDSESHASPSNQWSSQESGYLEWDTEENSFKTERNDNSPRIDKPSINNIILSEAKCPELSSPSPVENIGCKINATEFAVQKWQGRTPSAKNIIKGYYAISSRVGLNYLRRIRSDNYCGIRATIFQVLLRGYTLPNSKNTFEYLSQESYIESSNWLQNWTFPGGLEYQGRNALHGMRSCLESLDRMRSVLSSSNSREETLVALLNSDSNLDVHIMEGVKLHMLKSAMELQKTSCSALDVSLLAALMCTSYFSGASWNFMEHHSKVLGRFGDLEQVEMFLLAHSLQVTLKVVRPSAYGTEEFVCSYPDFNVGAWPEVVLLAETDRQYSVLVN